MGPLCVPFMVNTCCGIPIPPDPSARQSWLNILCFPMKIGSALIPQLFLVQPKLSEADSAGISGTGAAERPNGRRSRLTADSSKIFTLEGTTL